MQTCIYERYSRDANSTAPSDRNYKIAFLGYDFIRVLVQATSSLLTTRNMRLNSLYLWRRQKECLVSLLEEYIKIRKQQCLYSVYIQYLLSYIKKFIYHLTLSFPTNTLIFMCMLVLWLSQSFPFERFSEKFYSKAFAVYFIRRCISFCFVSLMLFIYY